MFDEILSRTAKLDPYAKGQVRDNELDSIEAFHKERPLTDGERHVLYRLRCHAIGSPPMGDLTESMRRLNALVDGEPTTLLLVPGEHWSDAVHHDLGKVTPKARAAWLAILRHACSATAGKPSAKWVKQVAAHRKPIQPKTLRELLAAWFSAFARGRSLKMFPSSEYDTFSDATFNENNLTVVKGLVWMLAGAADASTPRVLADLLQTSIRKVPGVGPRAVKVANACVWALGELAASNDDAIRDGALGQLARLKSRVTFRTTLNAIDKALTAAAEKAGVSREDLEELGTPSFGFENGRRDEQLGGASVSLQVVSSKVEPIWTNDKGKTVKSPPAAVKRDFKDDVKEVKQAATDAADVLSSGAARLDKLYLSQKTWPLSDFCERYLDHCLLGSVARRLIWAIGDDIVMFNEQGDAVGIDGKAIDLPAEDSAATVRLWHPIESSQDDVLAWRDRLAALEITQPFKQAYREVYLLTDAELNTNTYSNRFAAHIVRQHQFNALCAARGWKNQLRLMVDDAYEPAFRELPAHAIRAEYWVEGVGDNYGADTTESGTYLHLATDQVRFYRQDAARNLQHASGGRYDSSGGDVPVNHPMHLADVPPIVLSEILRDCDLFVGVASVGNDPTWQDGGPQGRFQTYWESYSFGDLSQTAKTRKAVLEKLIPRLKIAERCSFTDKFLVVRGDVRTYKIHLGSGNILMEPNDQYLCIVPDRRTESKGDAIHLPFEGDRTLSIVLSKALLLAEDKKIKDGTILTQIHGR